MRNRLPPQPVLAAFVLMCWGFLPTGCASVFHGTTQRIPVVTEPSGATATLEGQSTVTPGVLRVSRKATSAEIRIEKEGYVPRTIRLTRHVSGLVWTDLGWGVGTASLAVAAAPAFVLSDRGTASADALAGAGLGLSALGLAADFRSGGAYFLKPRKVVVKLEPRSPESSPLVGSWEAVSRSKGGLGTILDFNPDGSAVFTYGPGSDETEQVAYEMFSADGRFSFRLPIGSRCGLYSVSEDRLTLQNADDLPQSFRYRFENDELVLTADSVRVPIGNRAREHRYKRGHVIPEPTGSARESRFTR